MPTCPIRVSINPSIMRHSYPKHYQFVQESAENLSVSSHLFVASDDPVAGLEIVAAGAAETGAFDAAETGAAAFED